MSKDKHGGPFGVAGRAAKALVAANDDKPEAKRDTCDCPSIDDVQLHAFHCPNLPSPPRETATTAEEIKRIVEDAWAQTRTSHPIAFAVECYRRALAAGEDTAGWKAWHRELCEVLGLEVVERSVTLAKVAALKEVSRD